MCKAQLGNVGPPERDLDNNEGGTSGSQPREGTASWSECFIIAGMIAALFVSILGLRHQCQSNTWTACMIFGSKAPSDPSTPAQ
jgi:hypothetical protein